MAAHQLGQLADAWPFLAAIDRGFHPLHPLWCQNDAGELTEFHAKFLLGEGLPKIAAMTLARMRRLTAVRQGYAHAGRAQPRCDGAHRRVFAHMHAVTQCRDDGIFERAIVELGIAGVPPDGHHRRSMRQRVF